MKRICLLLLIILFITSCGKKEEVVNKVEENDVTQIYECVASNSYLNGATKNTILLEFYNDIFVKYSNETLYVFTEGTVNIDDEINKDKLLYDKFSNVRGVTSKYEKVSTSSYKSTFSLDIENLDFSSFISVGGYSANDKEISIFKKNQLIDTVLDNYSLGYTCELK